MSKLINLKLHICAIYCRSLIPQYAIKYTQASQDYCKGRMLHLTLHMSPESAVPVAQNKLQINIHFSCNNRKGTWVTNSMFKAPKIHLP